MNHRSEGRLAPSTRDAHLWGHSPVSAHPSSQPEQLAMSRLQVDWSAGTGPAWWGPRNRSLLSLGIISLIRFVLTMKILRAKRGKCRKDRNESE